MPSFASFLKAMVKKLWTMLHNAASCNEMMELLEKEKILDVVMVEGDAKFQELNLCENEFFCSQI